MDTMAEVEEEDLHSLKAALHEAACCSTCTVDDCTFEVDCCVEVTLHKVLLLRSSAPATLGAWFSQPKTVACVEVLPTEKHSQKCQRSGAKPLSWGRTWGCAEWTRTGASGSDVGSSRPPEQERFSFNLWHTEELAVRVYAAELGAAGQAGGDWQAVGESRFLPAAGLAGVISLPLQVKDNQAPGSVTLSVNIRGTP
jgi:hypothetical protein